MLTFVRKDVYRTIYVVGVYFISSSTLFITDEGAFCSCRSAKINTIHHPPQPSSYFVTYAFEFSEDSRTCRKQQLSSTRIARHTYMGPRVEPPGIVLPMSMSGAVNTLYFRYSATDLQKFGARMRSLRLAS